MNKIEMKGVITDDPQKRNFIGFLIGEDAYCIHQFPHKEGGVASVIYRAVLDQGAIVPKDVSQLDVFLSQLMEKNGGQPIFHLMLNTQEEADRLPKALFKDYAEYQQYCMDHNSYAADSDDYEMLCGDGKLKDLLQTIIGAMTDPMFESLVPYVPEKVSANQPNRAQTVAEILFMLNQPNEVTPTMRRTLLDSIATQLPLEKEPSKIYQLFKDRTTDPEVWARAIATPGDHFTGEQIISICKELHDSSVYDAALASDKLNEVQKKEIQEQQSVH